MYHSVATFLICSSTANSYEPCRCHRHTAHLWALIHSCLARPSLGLKGWCLGIDGECNLVGTVPAANPLSKFRFVPVAPGSEWAAPLLSSVPTFDESVKLLEEDLMHFVREGFLHVPGAVDSALVDAALAAINATLCSPGGGAVVGEDGTMQYCPSLRGRAEIQSLLYRSKVWTIAQLLLGRDKVQRCEGGQIALRPPQVGQGAARHRAGEGVSLPPRQWHIDGMGKGKHSPFSLLVGVSLSPQETDGMLLQRIWVCGGELKLHGMHTRRVFVFVMHHSVSMLNMSLTPLSLLCVCAFH